MALILDLRSKFRRAILVATTLTLSALTANQADAQRCRQALALGLDVSLSVNTIDFSLQRGGLARALLSPEVMQAFLSDPDDLVYLAVFEWSGQYDQALLVDWTPVVNAATLTDIAAILLEAPQLGRTGRTAIGAAMRYGADLMRSQLGCGTLTLDLSGDGPNNNGDAPERVRNEMQAQNITVNGLVIETGEVMTADNTIVLSPLREYYEDRVIVGSTSFVETAFGFSNFEAAMKRKLLQELIPAVASR
ncbi:MAG: DUF1194 domain-containing protein [Pseudomonadota bacterium]